MKSSMCSITYTGQRTTKMLICGRAHQSRQRQAKLASVNEYVVLRYASLAAALFGPDSALQGRETQARNQSETHENNFLEKISRNRKCKAMKQSQPVLRIHIKIPTQKLQSFVFGNSNIEKPTPVVEPISVKRSPSSTRSFSPEVYILNTAPVFYQLFRHMVFP